MAKIKAVPIYDNDYVVHVDHPNIVFDNYIVDELKIIDDIKYSFVFKCNEKLNKLTTIDTKKMLINTYNLGKHIYDKFTYEHNLNNDISITKNIFLTALYEQQLEYQGSLKSITKQITKKLNINLSKDKHDSEKMELFYKEKSKIQSDIYLRRLNELMEVHNICQKDYVDLIKLINKWLKTCGLSKKDIDLLNENQNILPIALLSYKIFIYINTGTPNLQVNITFKTNEQFDKPKMELSVESINDLLYYLAQGYRVFGGYGYIICEVCGNMTTGHKGRYTCSEICKKIRNGSYNKKK